MFGFVNNALENLVIRTYGFEKWKEVLLEAGVSLDEHHFLKSLLYDDYDTYALVEAACHVLDVNSEELMEKFGDQFFKWCQESGYDQVLLLLGRTLGEFLASLDALHDHLQLTYPGMQAPSFRIAKHPTAANGLYLHYDSVRVGLQHIVRGIILTVARSIFHMEVDIEIVETSQNNPARFHAIFSIIPQEADSARLWQEQSALAPASSLSSSAGPVSERDDFMSKEAFCQLFPFHILFDRDLVIKQCGHSFARLLPKCLDSESKLSLQSVLILERPHTTLAFSNILQHLHTVFVMKMRNSKTDFVAPKFKGQMMYLPHIDCIIYVCSPRVHRLKELEEQGLYLSDIPMHDATREIVMTAEASHAHLNMFQKLEETTDELLSSKNALTVEKCRTDALLHSILPKSVAKQILSKREVVPEVYGAVTILFSDICGFTSICGQSSPIEVIGMLNELYTLFDYLTTVNDVYKVETIGDAYMVVGGLPEKCDDHASRIANFAMDMRHACSKVMRPDKPDQPIEIRIGFHSGEVMAGVVGTKTPRYCLFGDCVNIASRTESNGIAGRINLSNDAYENLDTSKYILEDRGDVAFKGRADNMHCWFLNGHASREPTEVTLNEAREVSTFLDAMAESEKLNSLPLSPYNSKDPTPKNSLTDRNNIRLSRVGDGTEPSAAALPRLRKSSVHSAPSREALNEAADTVADGGISPMLRRSQTTTELLAGRATGGRVSTGCPIMSASQYNGDDSPSIRRMPRRSSMASFGPRSTSEPMRPALSDLDPEVLERHGITAPSSMSTARSSRAERMVAVGNNAGSGQSSCKSSASSTLSTATPVPAAPPSSSSSGWLRLYAAGSTVTCVGLLSLLLYQKFNK
ncbi:guanylate cyclase soluble subunit beta-1-like [Sycon ciliatum]|uniref:guanylate cyclase soluble subunit beta-1-like n=1 Tax=Sycon ciliatum TaxID=27933 RepID=UPI0020A9D650|eukprot:scpid41502/ scgid8641/ Guanylate cyclase soluble subunit beta-1; Guanylate cyclase soluble subunit beta-3; Soluble guanylate cyclase small subunit